MGRGGEHRFNLALDRRGVLVMVLLPCSPCCAPCPADDSDGSGAYFETDLKSSSIEDPSRWITRNVSYESFGLRFSTGYAARCTFLDLTRDAEIEIQVTAATFGGVMGIALDATAFASAPTGGSGGRFIRCSHFKFSPTKDIVYCYQQVSFPAEIETNTLGVTNVAYAAKFRTISGSWTASLDVNGTSMFSNVPCPDFSLPGRRFYHGIAGTNEEKLLSRYYMKLTYLT